MILLARKCVRHPRETSKDSIQELKVSIPRVAVSERYRETIKA